MMANNVVSTLLVVIKISIFIFSLDISADTLPVKNGQVWVGSYQCGSGQGETNLQLNIDEVSTKSTTSSKGIEVYSVVATYTFKSRAGSGSFVIQGAFAPKSRLLSFVPTRWLQRPPRFSMVGLQGNLSDDGSQYAGEINFQGCGNFKVSLNDKASLNKNFTHNNANKNQQHNPYAASKNPPLINREKKQAQVKPKKVNSTGTTHTDDTATKELKPTEDMNSIYVKAGAALQAQDWDAAYKYFHQFYNYDPPPPQQHRAYAKKTMQTLINQKGVIPENRMNASNTSGILIGGTLIVPQGGQEYTLAAGKVRTKQDIASSLNALRKDVEAMGDLTKQKKNVAAQYEEVLKNKVLPQLKEDAKSIIAFMDAQPADNNDFLQTISVVEELNKMIYVSSPINVRIYPFYIKAVSGYRGSVTSNLKKYVTQYTGTGLNIPQIIEEIYANAWNIYGTRKILKKYFPENLSTSNLNTYPKAIRDIMPQVSNRADFYWERLPEDSTPKKQARKIVRELKNIAGLEHATRHLKNKNYYPDYELKHLPIPIRAELENAEQRRRKQGKNLIIDFAYLSEPRSKELSIYGFVFNKTPKSQVIDDYTTMLERKLATPEFMLPRIGANATGFFDRPFYLKKKEIYLDDNKTSIYCMNYSAIRNDNKSVTDCFYFVDELLVGVKLDYSEKRCIEICSGYMTPLKWVI